MWQLIFGNIKASGKTAQLEIRLDIGTYIICVSGFSHDQSDKDFFLPFKICQHSDVIAQNITKASHERKLMSLCGRWRIATSEYMIPLNKLLRDVDCICCSGHRGKVDQYRK